MAASIALYKVYTDFQAFVFSNNVLVAAAGFSMGAATKECIVGMMSVTVLPALRWLVNTLHVESLAAIPMLAACSQLFGIFVEWMATIAFTFILLEYLLNRTVFGMKSTVKAEEKKDFIKAKAEAKIDKIIPTSQAEVRDILKEKATDDKIVAKAKAAGANTIEQIINTEVNRADGRAPGAAAPTTPRAGTHTTPVWAVDGYMPLQSGFAEFTAV